MDDRLLRECYEQYATALATQIDQHIAAVLRGEPSDMVVDVVGQKTYQFDLVSNTLMVKPYHGQ